MLHDYLRDTLESRYNECKSCNNRTQFTCILCGFCYSCHWKKEEMEKQIQFKPLIANSTLFKKYPQSIPAAIVPIKQEGQQSEQQQHQLQEDHTSYWCIWYRNRTNLQLSYMSSPVFNAWS